MKSKEYNFKTQNEILTHKSEFKDFLRNVQIKIVNEIEDFVKKESQ